MILQLHLPARPMGRLRALLAHALLAFVLPAAVSDGAYSTHLAALTQALRQAAIKQQEP